MAGHFEIQKSKDGKKFFFNLKASNGQVILTSEQYAAKAGVKNGIESVRKNCADDARFDRRTASNGKPYFVLLAANGQVIGQSQMYASSATSENGINSVKTNAPEAEVKDLT